MRFVARRRTLRGVPGSLTRRQLLIRTGGASAALVCFGALPVSATADPTALSSARAVTYASILDAINADPGYELADRAYRASRFAEIYAASGDDFRACADAVLDDVAERGVGTRRPVSGSPPARAAMRSTSRACHTSSRATRTRSCSRSHEHIPAQVHRHRADGDHTSGANPPNDYASSSTSRGGRHCAQPRAGCGSWRTGLRCSEPRAMTRARVIPIRPCPWRHLIGRSTPLSPTV